MNQKSRNAWRGRASALVMTGLLLVGALGPGTAETSAAKHRAGARKFQAFSNPASIAIPSNAQAAPSAIIVSGFNTPISDVDVSLNVLTHPTASDLDILLVGPGGQTALIMSEAGDDTANDSLSFSDQAQTQLPPSEALVSGTFQPTNYEFGSAPDTFQPPAPANPASGSALAVFNGTDANGTWTLYIREQDAVPVETGTLAGGWTLRITTASGVPTTQPDSFQAQAGQTLNVPATGVLSNDSDPDDDPLTAILAGQPSKGQATMQPDGSFSYRANKKAKGADSFTYLARDSNGLTALETVTIQVKGKKHKKHKKH